MCGKFNLISTREQLAQLFSVDISDEISGAHRPQGVATPGSTVIGISADGSEGNFHFRYYRWGLTPKWLAGDLKTNYLFNTRSETIRDKYTFRSAFQYRRAIIPADNFWEWSSVKDPDLSYKKDQESSQKYIAESLFSLEDGISRDQQSRSKKTKQGFTFYRNDKIPFALAAIFEISVMPKSGLGTDVSYPAGKDQDLYIVKEKKDVLLYSCSIITTAANHDMSSIHDRQPVILEERDWGYWLDHQSTSGELIDLLKPAPDGIFRCEKSG